MDIEEIEDLIGWNLSYNISVAETLADIGRMDLIDFFDY